MTGPYTPPGASDDEASDAQALADPAARARELIERGDYRRARRALASLASPADADDAPPISDPELARLRAALGVDPAAIALTVASALALLIVVLLLAL